MWDVLLNGGIGVASLVVVLMVIKQFEKTAHRQQELYAELMKNFIQSVVDKIEAQTDAIRELTNEVRREK